MIKTKNIAKILLFIILTMQICSVAAQKQRFPKPEFESGHTQPDTIIPDARSDYLYWLDVAVLIGAMSLITWLVVKKRSRKGVFWMSVFSVLYFGFYKEGCICSIGAIQNVTLAIFDSNYNIPVTAVLFFVIPLIYTLFFGRTFCAGVCPFGALQDLVAFRPLHVKAWLEKVLGIIPFIYLALAVLYAATGTDFIICRYDPFIGFFRLDATFTMFAIGGIFLIIGIFIARPYCRYLCPYGALLNLVSRFAGKHMTITPNDCIQCRLCEDSCPVGAINKPVPLKEKEPVNIVVRRFIILSLIVPVLMLAGGFIGSTFHENLAIVNSKVRLANELINDTNYGLIDEDALEITAFNSAGESVEKLYTEAAQIVDVFYTGGWFFGGFVGLVFGLTLIGLTVFKYRTDYTPNKATCHSCAKCMDYCPVDKENAKL